MIKKSNYLEPNYKSFNTDEEKLVKLVPPKHRRQAATLLRQFDARGNELTWNSDGIIFIDQTSIPNSNIYVLFPYLFKHKHPKPLPGFDDFINKIKAMGLEHLILQKSLKTTEKVSFSNQKSEPNWWYLG